MNLCAGGVLSGGSGIAVSLLGQLHVDVDGGSCTVSPPSGDLCSREGNKVHATFRCS